MARLRYIILLITLILLPSVDGSHLVYAQKKTTTTRKATTTTQKKATTTAKKSTTTTKKTSTAQKVDKKTQLRNEKAAMEQKRKLSQQQAAQLNKSIKSNLDSVMILDNQIGKQKASIDSLSGEINHLTKDIVRMQEEIDSLQQQLELKKKRYAKAITYQRKNRSIQQKLMFIFSSDNFSQLIRRMRYVSEYSTFQKAQGLIIKEQQAEIKQKKNQLLEAKTRLEAGRVTMQNKQRDMERMKSSCQTKVTYLNKNLATVQRQIKEYQDREAALNAEIDRIIQAEIEAARRAEAERKRKAEEARRKAEEAAREKARKLAEAKAAQERARRAQAEAEARRKAADAARKAAKTEEERAAAKAAAEQAKADAERAKAEEKTAKAEIRVAEKEEKEASKTVANWNDNNSDVKLSTSFTANKGRLPMPITGSYQIVGHYGKYSPPGLSKVVLDNKGIDIRGQQGSQARAVFDGEVSSVFSHAGRYIVMIRHGRYISVYSGLASVSVSKGQKVSTKTPLGVIGTNTDGNYVLHFQLRNEAARLNPEQWVR